MIQLHYYPDYIGDNQYIELFYQSLQAYGVASRDGLVVRESSLREEAADLDVIQIQWCPERIWRSHDLPSVRRLPRHLWRVVRLGRYLRLARRLGIKVIWTIHDFVHHDQKRSPFVDLCGYRLLARYADLCICHSEDVRKEVIRQFWSRPETTVVMPIGNYDGIYPDPNPRETTLRQLGIADPAKVLLMFGAVRPYKGIELALDALRGLEGGYQLIVVGAPLDQAYGDELRAHGGGLPNVHFLLEHVDKQRLADLVHAADCVLLPYRRITGSSAILAALTLGRAVVASDLTFFRDILAEVPEAGVLFEPGDAKGLGKAIETFFELPVATRNAAARRLADRYDWSRVIRPVAEWFEKTFPAKIEAVAPAARPDGR